ncbi:hypothetical protein AVEN_217857-1 [Araneus ventricosus]|uniref:DUF7041 domain-containing protein n=1 Tax=Araneus ventricosus TaxID=182803 RepID=A0A4Y2QXA1_ARAVE|nr:hypothetical protein AVEN_217857-1 [Araneus ventricosus]
MPNDQSGKIARVAVKAPPFWHANPALWIRQMESQFTLAGVTSEITKFHYIVAALQPEELEIVGDIMLNPPADESYGALRTRLCSQYADSEEQRFRDLIFGMQLGDRKPSRPLLEMRSKAENKISEELMKSLFLQRLPTHLHQILAISNDKLDRLAEMTDGIMPAATDTVAIRTVTLEEANLQTILMEISSRQSRSRSRESGRRFRPRSASREVGNPAHCCTNDLSRRLNSADDLAHSSRKTRTAVTQPIG